LTGIHPGHGSVHIYAKHAQAYARTADACFDQPDLTSVFTFRVTAPVGWVVLSNQPQADIERTLHDSQTVRFHPTPPLPTFTTTVVAGRGLDYYTGWLGADYPYAKYGQVFVPEFPHLASEDAGCVMLSALWQQADWLLTPFASPGQATEARSLLKAERALRARALLKNRD
jgi:aminopeptidase N